MCSRIIMFQKFTENTHRKITNEGSSHERAPLKVYNNPDYRFPCSKTYLIVVALITVDMSSQKLFPHATTGNELATLLHYLAEVPSPQVSTPKWDCMWHGCCLFGSQYIHVFFAQCPNVLLTSYIILFQAKYAPLLCRVNVQINFIVLLTWVFLLWCASFFYFQYSINILEGSSQWKCSYLYSMLCCKENLT